MMRTHQRNDGEAPASVARRIPDCAAGAVLDTRCLMFDADPMRTTLTLDDDILQAAREIAASRRMTVGEVLSDLARRALQPRKSGQSRNGVPLLPRRPRAVRKPTMDLVNRLRDES